MSRFRTAVLVSLAAAVAGTPAEAYYHYIHYLNGNQGTPVYDRFDLSTLPNKTLTFFVVDSGPRNYGANDDFASVLSQVEQAAAAWNSIDSSDLRVAYGGLESQAQSANTPGGDVIFTDLPPGLLGMGGVSIAANQPPVTGPNSTFFPITRSLVQLTNDTSKAPGPSYLESYFTTAVHEIGHALGLQHTWTSAAMSQDVIRNTSRARPLDADDRAALSVLYGKAGWASNYGSISGRVTANGQPVALASVVAIPPNGPAVSALTNPDGSYTIAGIPPGNYLLYVHPLPPDAIAADGSGLLLPVDQNNNALPAYGSAFRTVFAPGTGDLGQASTFFVSAGSAVTGQNFSVAPQAAVSMYDVVTYSYSNANKTWNSPAFVSSAGAEFTLEARENPPLVTPIPQSVTILGGFGTASVCPAQNAALPCFVAYDSNSGQVLSASTANPAASLAIYFNVPLFAGAGPRHMVFKLPNGDIYVLPDALNLVEKNPPAISAITQNGDGSVTISGTAFGADTRVFFDGQPAPVTTSFSGTDSQGSISVMPPPGYSGQQASVIVYNGDGQNSTFYQTQSPPLYAYPAAAAPQVTINPSSLPAGVSSMIDITNANMQFIDGEVTAGLGTSDVSVRRVWVVTPSHAIANVVVSPNAVIGSSEVSVLSGFQSVTQPGGFQIQPASTSLPFLALPILNADPYQPILYPGASVSIYGNLLSTAPNSTQITLNGQAVPVPFSSAGQVSFVIPAGFPTGLATLNLNNGAVSAPPLTIQIDKAPPAILQIANASGQVLDSSHVPSMDDTLVATVANVDPSVVGNPGRVQVTVAGGSEAILQVAAGPQNGTVAVTFMLGQAVSGAVVPVVVSVDGVRSSPYTIAGH